MAAAIFALAGTALGIAGTLSTEFLRRRSEDLRAHRESLRLACAEFTAAVARMWTVAIEQMRNPADAGLLNSMRDAHREARVHYERLRLTSGSREVQEAGRLVLRYAFGLLRQAEGKEARDDERERGPVMMLHDSLMTLYAAVRRELGVPHAEEVYREPDDWVGPTWIPNNGS